MISGIHGLLTGKGLWCGSLGSVGQMGHNSGRVTRVIGWPTTHHRFRKCRILSTICRLCSLQKDTLTLVTSLQHRRKLRTECRLKLYTCCVSILREGCNDNNQKLRQSSLNYEFLGPQQLHMIHLEYGRRSRLMFSLTPYHRVLLYWISCIDRHIHNLSTILSFCGFYRAMLRGARYCYGESSVCPSVCPWRRGIIIT